MKIDKEKIKQNLRTVKKRLNFLVREISKTVGEGLDRVENKDWDKIFKSKITFYSAVFLAVAFLSACVFWLFLYFGPSPSLENNIGKKVFDKIQNVVNKPVFLYHSHLDGQGVETAEEESPKVLTVMIDNHPDARPQFGLSQAKVVYEAQVEGGFTRYMAVFEKGQGVEKVGPVRSARPYFLDWNYEYGLSAYMHCGGSPQALNRIKEENIISLNQFYNDQYYWRDYDFVAPHNLFTGSEEWQDYFADESSGVDWQGWLFDFEPEVKEAAVKRVVLPYSYGYEVSWNFEDGEYFRYVNNQEDKDANNNETISAQNILVQFVKTSIIDDYGRRSLQTIGSNEAMVFSNGQMIKGTWKKDSLSERTEFLDENGEEIKLIPGKTWVQVVPTVMEVGIGS